MRIFFTTNKGCRISKLLVAGLVVISACFLASSCLGYQKPKYTHNYNHSVLLGHSSFDLSAEEVGTSARGNILISKSKLSELDIRIVSSFVIAPGDWAGVRMIFPRGCYVQDILCTYVDDNRPDSSFWFHDYTDLLSEYGIEFGIGGYFLGGTTSGGEGVVVVDLVMPIDNGREITELEFSIYIGTKLADDGFWTVGVACETVMVQFEYE